MFSENEKLLGKAHGDKIKTHSILIVGLGGLGGFIANALVRLGARHLVLVDNDVFEESNLNRQLFSHQDALNQPKVKVVKEELLKINPQCQIDAFINRIEDIENEPLIEKATVVFDAVDSIQVRLWIERFASKKKIPLVHGALGGWYGEIAFIEPGVKMLEMLYGKKKQGIEKDLGSPTFTPPIVANMMVTEFIKWLHDDEELLRNRLLIIDLKNHSYQVVFDLAKK